MRSVSVREATVEDARAVRRVCVAGWETAYDGLLPAAYVDANVRTFYAVERLRNEIAAGGTDAAGPWLVAVGSTDDSAGGDAVVGAGRGTPPEGGRGEVFTLYVHPDAQGRGVGSRLLEAITDRQRDAGATEQVVEVFAGAAGAFEFYERRGFERIGDRKTDVVAGVDPDHRTVRLGREI